MTSETLWPCLLHRQLMSCWQDEDRACYELRIVFISAVVFTGLRISDISCLFLWHGLLDCGPSDVLLSCGVFTFPAVFRGLCMNCVIPDAVHL